jgi:DTW domain-containing protein YfiP
MRTSGPRSQNSRCLRCCQRREICVCPILPTVHTQAEFLILRHITEAGRPSNTGRLVALSMPNSRIVSCGGGARIGRSSLDAECLMTPGTWLLWPDGPDTRPDRSDLVAPNRVVVLDATWHQARRLYVRTPALRALPRLTLPAPARNRDRLREQHRTDGMSTLEAVAAAVARLEGACVSEPLERLYDEVVRRTTALRWGTKPS